MNKVLQIGSTEAEVQRLAKILADQGYYEITHPVVRFNAEIEDAVIYFQQTHIGKDGAPLLDDGVVGDDTWWALKHPSGKAQKNGLIPKMPKGIGSRREDILTVAIAEHAKGIKEQPMGSNRGKEVDKYLPKWWLEKNGPNKKGPAWCCFFVHWVYGQALGMYPTSRSTGSCAKLMERAKMEGSWRPVVDPDSGKDVARPGQVFLIAHPTKPGKPKTGHVGIVHCINKSQTIISTIEGNCGNRVKCGLRAVPEITGFIDPIKGEPDILPFSKVLPKVEMVGKKSTR